MWNERDVADVLPRDLKGCFKPVFWFWAGGTLESDFVNGLGLTNGGDKGFVLISPRIWDGNSLSLQSFFQSVFWGERGFMF